MKERQIQLKRRMDALSFSIWELHLFLDSHPYNQDATKKYWEYKEKLKELKEEYKRLYGTPYENSEETCRWQWINSPWPWQLDEEDDC